MQNKTERRASAEKRQEFFKSLTVIQKLDALDFRLGKGKGATKERARYKNESK